MTSISRRHFIQTMAVVAASHSLLANNAFAESGFSLPPLPYDPAALEPAIDAETMKIHHDKHHRAYVDKLNEQVMKNPALAAATIEDIVRSVSKYPEAVRNNGGGHYNHLFFWSTMAPAGKGGEPSALLKKAIDAEFGGLDAMKEALNAAALARFGSGWGWLVHGSNGKLTITSTPNQDNPAMDIADVKGKPLLGVDVWEHAYYLKYQNRRSDYLKNWWSIVDWNSVNLRFAAA